MMKIKLLRGTVIDGKAENPGVVVDVDQSLAIFLLNTGKGEVFTEKTKESAESQKAQNRETAADVKKAEAEAKKKAEAEEKKKAEAEAKKAAAEKKDGK
jgi:stringent starvation protein B